MPLTTTIQETRKIIAGAQCVSRYYPNGCPHKVGTNLLLAFEKPNGEMQPYAHARVMGIAALPMDTRSSAGLGGTLAEGEGYEDVESWSHHFVSMYGKLQDGVEVHRLQLTIRLLDGAQPAPSREAMPDENGIPGVTGVPNVGKVQVSLPRGQTKTVGSVDSLEAVAELENQMFGG